MTFNSPTFVLSRNKFAPYMPGKDVLHVSKLYLIIVILLKVAICLDEKLMIILSATLRFFCAYHFKLFFSVDTV